MDNSNQKNPVWGGFNKLDNVYKASLEQANISLGEHDDCKHKDPSNVCEAATEVL